MDQLLAAVEEYFTLPTNIEAASPEEPSPMPIITPAEYNERMRHALQNIIAAQIALDDAHINVQDHRSTLHTALRKAQTATRKKTGATNLRLIFSSVFGVSAPDFVPLFGALLARKELSQMSISAPSAPV